MKVAVVGSGIGGLAAAIGLQRAGAEVTVVEQSADLRPHGSGLSIFGNGLRALDALGLGADFRAISTAQAAELTGGQRRPDGSWVSVYPMDAVAQLRIVDRADLHAMLTAALAPGTVRSGAPVTGCSPDGTLSVSGREDERFDVIIGADGLRSTVRTAWPADPGIRYAGYGSWRGITQQPVELHGEAGETWGVDTRFGLAPLGDGRVYWFGVIGAPAGRRFSADRQAVAAVFADWHAPIPGLIAATNPAAISYLPIEELAGRLPSFVRGRIVLLGDAAHAMTPNLGQGGNQALEDAATLTRLLAPLTAADAHDTGRLIVALDRYDALRRPRTQQVAARSRLVGQIAHRPGLQLSRLRDRLMHLIPASVLRRQLDALQDWQPPS
ncbi:FAD-dependent monooxygenase [Brevibacterium luteolum]|uniref:FAD-dependent monooxygenase n=1 Tax=Brevibacterium luteolum TaxID=199591 RepID=UPI003B67F85C